MPMPVGIGCQGFGILIYNRLITNSFVKGRISRCEMRPFSVQLTAF